MGIRRPLPIVLSHLPEWIQVSDAQIAERFYRKFGFELMPPTAKRAMYLLMSDAEATITDLSTDKTAASDTSSTASLAVITRVMPPVTSRALLEDTRGRW